MAATNCTLEHAGITAKPDTGGDDSPAYVVAFAKIVDDKHDGVYVQGVYFGGIASTQEEAERVARDCVQAAKGGTIMPRIIPTPSSMSILDAMNRAVKRFEQIESQMFQAEDIMNRAATRR